MKKFVSVLLVLIVLTIVCVGMMGCEAHGEENLNGYQSPLIGSWQGIMPINLGMGVLNYDIILTYNANGTGRQAMSHSGWQWEGYIDFTWTAEDGIITLTITGVGDGFTPETSDAWIGNSEISTYSIEGDIMTSYHHEIGETFTFTRVVD